MTDDDSLCRRLQRQDEKALEEIMKKYISLISAVIFNCSRGRLRKEDREEVLIDTFLTLWKNREKTAGDTLKGYLCCMAKSRTFDRMDKTDTIHFDAEEDIDELEPADERSLEGHVEQKDINRVLGEIVDNLQPPDNEIVIRYYYYYQSIAKIAAVMGLTSDNVKIRLYRARKQIKKLLTERGYHDGT